MTRKILWAGIVVLSILIGLYPGIYFFVERTFGLLRSKPNEVLTDTFWNVAFYTHIILGGLALLIGWTQFAPKFRSRNLTLHRRIGMVYIMAVMLSGVAGIYIGFFATGGIGASLGFISLGITWLVTTIKAYIDIRKGRIIPHQKMMIFSYAACFSAVTLRLWLPLLVLGLRDFNSAYLIVAWLCWMPNMLVAFFITKQMGHRPQAEVQLVSK